MQTTAPVRLAHFSDIHVTVRRVGWRREDWVNKRLAAWLNSRFFRGRRFRGAEAVLDALTRELHQRAPDWLVFSGDATAMGFEEEVLHAASLLGVDRYGGLAVPGNHDYCTRTAMHAGHFERHFAPWQIGRRVCDEIYPFAQRVGHLWLIGVNSATANRYPWDARGEVGAAQLERLQKLLSVLEEGPKILVTHYPVARASGRPEPMVRELRDLDDLVGVASDGGVGLWLHGHRHDHFHHHDRDLAPFPIICAGSATQRGLWSYLEYTITGSRLCARQRVYQPDEQIFEDGGAFELALD